MWLGIGLGGGRRCAHGRSARLQPVVRRQSTRPCLCFGRDRRRGPASVRRRVGDIHDRSGHQESARRRRWVRPGARADRDPDPDGHDKDERPARTSDGTEFSFPSGHSAATFASATVLQRHFGWKVGVPAFAVASYVAASRVQEKRHFLSDVAFGATLGIIAGRTVTVGRGEARFAVSPMADTGRRGRVVQLGRVALVGFRHPPGSGRPRLTLRPRCPTHRSRPGQTSRMLLDAFPAWPDAPLCSPRGASTPGPAPRCSSSARTCSVRARSSSGARTTRCRAWLPTNAHRGVLAFSSGNHAQAVALAGQLLSIPRVVVMPTDAPAVKLAATLGYGAEVVAYDRRTEDREAIGRRLAGQRGLTVIPPFDHPHVIAGQGTAAMELFDEVGALNLLLVPCGGGGLLSGSALSAAALSPACRIVGVEPAAGDDATRSFRTKQLQRADHADTVADGARTPSLGTMTFPLVLSLVSDMMTVDDDALLRTMFYLWERLKLVVEPTGALGAAALFSGELDSVDDGSVSF